MANYVVSDTNLTAVANAIRQKGGTSASLEFPDDFVEAIGDIQTGGGSSVTVEALNVTQNGTYTAPSGTAYSPVTVSVSGGGGGGATIGLHTDTLPQWTTGSVESGNNIVDARSPDTTTYTYIGFTGFVPFDVGDSLTLTLTLTSASIANKITLYRSSSRGSQSLGTVTADGSRFVFTETNNKWRTDLTGFYMRDASTGAHKTWSASVTLSINGEVIF